MKESTTFNGNTCKELQDCACHDGHSSRINSLMASERKLRDQMNEVISKNLYLEVYSRRENIKFFSIPDWRRGGHQERTNKFYGKWTGISKRPNSWNTACPPNCWETWWLWPSPNNCKVPSLQGCGRHNHAVWEDASKELISRCLEIFHKKSLKGERISNNLQKDKTEWHESLVQ